MKYYMTSVSLAKIFILALSSFFIVAGSAQAGGDISGKVIETMNSGGYTYVHIQTDGEKKWVALPLTKVGEGDFIVVAPGVEMGAYTSPTLGRTFANINFTSDVKDVRRKISEKEDMETPEDQKDFAVEKAVGPDAFTIAELYARKAELGDKEVAVRGKVVKVSQFQGKNWLRLKDGSGSRRRGNHKLLVTSEQSAAQDEIVTARGVLKADMSIGGLLYDVLVEDAKLEK